MKTIFLNKKVFKGIIIAAIACIFFSTLSPVVNALVYVEGDVYQKLDQIDKEEFDLILSQITDYSEYDYENDRWVLNHAIVTDGIFTEQQFLNAEQAGIEWEKVENLVSKEKQEDIITIFALPALLVLAIKAVGVIAGTTVVSEITTAFTNWGLASGCNKFKKYGPIKSFCNANGY